MKRKKTDENTPGNGQASRSERMELHSVSYKSIKLRAFELVNRAEEGDRASRIFDLSILGLILLSVVAIILQSFDTLATRYARVFSAFEIFTVVVFTLEYLIRLWTADLLYRESKHPYLKYIFSFMAIVDLLAILPFYLPFLPIDLRYLRMVRLMRLSRLLRILKLRRYLNASRLIFDVLRQSVTQLVISIALCLFVMLFSAIIMYTVENPVQPEKFPNIIASMWWAICTLTTVGYGDVYPITPIGRFLTSIISLTGIGIIAIPTGIITSGFSNAINQRNLQRQERSEESGDEAQEEPQDAPKLYCPYCGHKLDK